MDRGAEPDRSLARDDAMTLKPWREIAEPHSDVREGKFHQATADQLVMDIHARLEEIGTEVQTVS